MNWENILKVQVLGNKQKVKMGIKPLPKEDSCLKRLKRWVSKIDALKDKFPPTEVRSISTNGMLLMTEESACKLLKEFKEAAEHLYSNDTYNTKPYHATLESPTLFIGFNDFDKTLRGSIVSKVVLIVNWKFIDISPGTIDDGVEFAGTLYLKWEENDIYLSLINIKEELRKIFREA